MSKLRVIFSRSHTIGSLIIRTVTWGPWSHCGVLTPQSTVIEAKWPDGVVETPFNDFVDRSSRVEVVRVWCPDPASAVAFARAQIGKPYDTLGVIGLGLRREWDQDDAWWCSEHLEATLAAGGNKRFRAGLRRITPAHSWMVT